jgi:hypothetical protein
MPHFIFMLTREDRTVADAHRVYASLAKTPLRHIGFKDIGLPFDELRSLAAQARRDGRQVMLEVVSSSREAELRSVEAAARLGVDCLLGGRHAPDAVRILQGTGVRYFPFAGHTQGHPTRLTGTVEEIVDDARRLAALPGVHGLDLLAYRFAGDAPDLARRVVQAVDLPVIAAGSIDSAVRVRAMRQAGVWAFTVGSAVFDGRFLPEPVPQQVSQQVDVLLRMAA